MYRFPSAVHLILLNDDRILMQRRFNTGYEDGNYSLVAGHLEGEETVKSAMIREALEEVNIHIREDKLDVVGIMHRRSDEERIDFFCVTESYAGNPEIMEPGKADELSWFHFDQLPDNTIPYIRRGIENYLSGKFFDTFGF